MREGVSRVGGRKAGWSISWSWLPERISGLSSRARVTTCEEKKSDRSPVEIGIEWMDGTLLLYCRLRLRSLTPLVLESISPPAGMGEVVADILHQLMTQDERSGILIWKTKHSHENVKYFTRAKKHNSKEIIKKKKTHHILKQASIDSLLNHHHSKLWFKRRTYRLECRKKLCCFTRAAANCNCPSPTPSRNKTICFGQFWLS